MIHLLTEAYLTKALHSGQNATPRCRNLRVRHDGAQGELIGSVRGGHEVRVRIHKPWSHQPPTSIDNTLTRGQSSGSRLGGRSDDFSNVTIFNTELTVVVCVDGGATRAGCDQGADVDDSLGGTGLQGQLAPHSQGTIGLRA